MKGKPQTDHSAQGQDRRRSREQTFSSQYTLGDYIDVLRRRWFNIAVILPTFLLAAVYIAFSLPPLYLASGTILLEQGSVPEDMIRSTVTTYADQQIELVQRQVITTDNLVTVVEEVDPYPHDTGLSNRDKARLVGENTSIEKVDPITLEPLAISSAFSVHYLNPDPEIAVEISRRLVELFLAFNRATRTQLATETYDFLKAQSVAVEKRVDEIEAELAEFKKRYGDTIPEAQKRNLAALDRTVRDLDAIQRQIPVVEERKELLELQLTEVRPNLFEETGGWQAELAQLRAELALARQRYTEDHPDVRRLRRSIEGLSERAAESPGTQPQPDNPEYLRLLSRLGTANAEIEALRSSARRAREQIRDYEERLTMAPGVELEYRQLSRDHEIALDQFREIQVKLREAALAQTLETEDYGEQFRVIREPSTPSSPYSPNRVGIVLLGIVLALVASSGVIAFKESVDPSIRSPKDLGVLTSIKPIGAVPIILNGQDVRRHKMVWCFLVSLLVVALTFVGYTISSGA